MADWISSILTYIDLIGIKDAASSGNSRGTDLMRRMHSLVHGRMSHGMNNHDHCYVWNDSILLLAYLDNPYRNSDENDILKEADQLKKDIDQICPSYAISVKGQVFPDDTIFHPPIFEGQIAEQPRVIRLKTSSYAMGNCFLIEKRLGDKLEKPWYIDGRIAKCL